MRYLLITISILIYYPTLSAQLKIEEDLDYAFQNAKKGVYYALSHIPDKKTKLDEKLVSNDKLVAELKLEKEVNGVKVESTGYYETGSVSIIIYRSNDTLINDGYLTGEAKEEVK